jgi:hypothetical protein
MASTAQPTEQCVQTVRLISIFPAPMIEAPSAACAFFTNVSCVAAIPTPTPKPERRKNARLSMVGKACDNPLRRLCTKGERSALAPEFDFLVNNMKLSKNLAIQLEITENRLGNYSTLYLM